MIDKKLVRNVTIRLNRTQTPPTPHSIRPKEEERLRIFRCIVEILQLGEIPVAYAYSVPEESSILGYMRQEFEQSELHDVPTDKGMSIDERIRQLVRELRILTRPQESLWTDSRGYLKDGGLLLRYAPLIEWYEALESLGCNAIPISDDDSTYFFPPVVSLEGEDLQMPALPLEEFRDRINRIRQGQWPRAEVEGDEGDSGSSPEGSDIDQPEDDTDDEEEGPNSQSGGGSEECKTTTIQLVEMIPVAQDRHGGYYRVPDAVKDAALPAKLVVSRKRERMGSLYDISEARIVSINEELKFGNREEGDGEGG